MKKAISINVVRIIFSLLILSSCNDEPVNLPKATLKEGSELFTLLQSVTNRGDDPIENSVCVDFVYPFVVIIYDSNVMPLQNVQLFSDAQFSQLLGQLPSNHSISISYPIETSLPDGTLFSINTDEELKISLETCSNEDIILYCNGLFENQGTCVWEVPYIASDLNNDYAGAVFYANPDGTISFYHLNNTYVGTWAFLFLNNRLFLNIYLSGSSPIAQYWSRNYKVILSDGTNLHIETPTETRKLKKDCSGVTLYSIGDVGPAGGIIAYDKGEFTNGWRYIEIAPNDLIIEEWGCINSEIENAQFDQIGTGFQNTVTITNYHNALTNYFLNPIICSNFNNGSVTAKTTLAETYGNKNDWCIPSINELETIYTNLHLIGIGNFTQANYWSSSEASISESKCVNFNSGETIILNKNSSVVKTRMIRFF